MEVNTGCQPARNHYRPASSFLSQAQDATTPAVRCGASSSRREETAALLCIPMVVIRGTGARPHSHEATKSLLVIAGTMTCLAAPSMRRDCRHFPSYPAVVMHASRTNGATRRALMFLAGGFESNWLASLSGITPRLSSESRRSVRHSPFVEARDFLSRTESTTNVLCGFNGPR